MAVLVETTIGDFVIDLYVDERPKTCLNFIKLCKRKYYNYCLFHSVERNFIAQAGDPEKDGGKSIWGLIKGDEFKYYEAEVVPRLKHKKIGTISMVNNGNDCNASQFYITLREDVDYLDGKHTIFGELAESEGLGVVRTLNETYCNKEGRPLKDIRILHTVVLDDPYDDPEEFTALSRSPSPPLLPADANHIGADEDINDFDGKTEREIEEMIETKESKANANILEMVGDIPDADAKPPEYVLFVCKLNPATTSEDLEIIFSRFGTIVSCEVIKDQKTSDSLQYAFIEFENEEDCTNAYFKMDNVLIDDRRIHVDFSQSLSKVKPNKRRLTSDGSIDPSARVKDKDGKYNMVFDDKSLLQEGSRGGSKKRGRSRSPSRRNQQNSNKKDNRGQNRSRSREHKSDRRERERSREKRRDRSRSIERGQRRSRSRERRNRNRSREGRRERHRSPREDTRRRDRSPREDTRRRDRSRDRTKHRRH